MKSSTRPLKIAVSGTGRVALELASASEESPWTVLIGAWTSSRERAGGDLGELHGVGPLGVPVLFDPETIREREDVDAVIYTGLADRSGTADILEGFALAGKDAITVGGLVHPEFALGEARAARLREAAIDGGARVLGTGINPGFFLDAMPAIAAGIVSHPRLVDAVRVTDAGRYGKGVLERELPVGTPATPESGLRLAATLPESLAVIVESLEIDVDAFVPIHAPLTAATTRTQNARTVERGSLVGFRSAVEARRDSTVVARIEWTVIFALDPEADGVSECATVTVHGDETASLTCAGDLLADGYPATAARALSAARVLGSLPPGLYRPDQVPASSLATGHGRARA